MTSASLMHEAGPSKLVALGQPRGMGWGGRREGDLGQEGGAHVHPWLIHVDVWQKPPHYCKVISLQYINFLKCI